MVITPPQIAYKDYEFCAIYNSMVTTLPQIAYEHFNNPEVEIVARESDCNTYNQPLLAILTVESEIEISRGS